MRRIVIGMHAGMAGTDSWEFYLVPESISRADLELFAWERAKDHAEMYGIYPRDEYVDLPDFDEDDESYSDSIEGWYEDYDANKHDCHRVGGDTSWNSY